jgi:poly-gamma-glutamate synthesis protein (capsule biosynthesis protein)
MAAGNSRPRARELPRTARDMFDLKLAERVFFDGSIAAIRALGLWSYPIRAEADLEHMTQLDKLYWLYKTQHPVVRARRGSGLEAFFAATARHAWRLPDGFVRDGSATVSAVGDLWTHAFVSRSRESLYASVDDLVFGADVAMANLEGTILAGAAGARRFDTREGPPLAFDRETFSVVRGGDRRGFDFLTTANNHSLDHGGEGVDHTIRVLREAGIPFHGVNARDADAAEPTILRSNGIVLGVVGYTFGVNARRPPTDRPGIVNRMALNGRPEALDLGLLDRQLTACAAAGVDFVIAQLHWGHEFESYPRPDQVEVAHRLAERGVDAIIGHHSHVVQPLEIYRTRRDPDRVVPIYYSLGNLVNPCSAPFMCRSAVARLSLAKGRPATGATGAARTYVEHAALHAVDQRVDSVRRVVALEPVAAARSANSGFTSDFTSDFTSCAGR